VLRRRQRQAPREPAAVVPTTARLGSRPRRPAEPCGGVGTDTRQQQHRNARHGLVARPYAARGLPSPPLARAFARAVSTSASWSCRWLRRAGAEADECSSLHGSLPHLLASSYISDLHHAFKTSSRFLHVKVRRL
jgi:hypothetical protein